MNTEETIVLKPSKFILAFLIIFSVIMNSFFWDTLEKPIDFNIANYREIGAKVAAFFLFLYTVFCSVYFFALLIFGYVRCSITKGGVESCFPDILLRKRIRFIPWLSVKEIKIKNPRGGVLMVSGYINVMSDQSAVSLPKEITLSGFFFLRSNKKLYELLKSYHEKYGVVDEVQESVGTPQSLDEKAS